MFRVIRTLDGAEFSAPRRKLNESGKYDENNLEFEGEREFSTKDLALLLTIASRQRDPEPDKGYPEKDCICYADRGTLMRISGIKHGSISRYLYYLVDSGLVTYRESAMCKHASDPKKKKRYDHVYQINWSRLMEEWHRTAKRLNWTEESQDLDEQGQELEGSVQELDTKNRDKETIEKNTTNSISLKEEDNHKKASIYVKYIIGKYGLTSKETDTKQPIDLDFIEGATKSKDPDAVKEVIDEHGKTYPPPKNPAPEEWRKWIGSLVKKLRKIAKKKAASAADIAAQFTPPEPELTPQEATKREAEKAVNDGWNKLVNDLALKEQDEAKKDELKGKLKAMFDSRPGEEKDAMNKLIADLPFENGCADFAEMCKKMLIDERVAALEKDIEKLTVKRS